MKKQSNKALRDEFVEEVRSRLIGPILLDEDSERNPINVT
jgi:hypothetical protein